MPAATPPARIPGTAVTPPSSHSISVGGIALGIHRGRLESRSLGPPEHDVEVLDAVRRAALAEVVDRRQAHRATGPGIGDHRDVAVVRPDDPARRGPVAFIQHADERLARVELSVDAEELRRRERLAERHGGGGEEPSVERHRSEEHTSELQSQSNLVCRLLLEKKKKKKRTSITPITCISDPACISASRRSMKPS